VIDPEIIALFLGASIVAGLLMHSALNRKAWYQRLELLH